MLRSQFSCLVTPKTQFQVEIDKSALYQKANCYKGKELLIEDYEEDPPIRYVKARPSQLFQHDLEALKHKTELINLDWYAMQSFYRLKECCFSQESDEKPPTDVVHLEIG